MRIVLPLAVGCAALSIRSSCSTSPKSGAERDTNLSAPPLMPAETFKPASFNSVIHLKGGRYHKLLSPDSYAVWVSEDVVALKRAKAVETGEEVNEQMNAALALVNANYFVFECHVESAFAGQVIAQFAVAKSADAEFASGDNAEEVEVVAVEQVEAAVASVVGAGGTGDSLHILDSVGGIVDGGEEGQITAVGVAPNGAEGG
ncbi:MAG: hypothetical protein QGG73_05210 [Candidatus Hydrogenedentes bacterium]|nr:hypothetical protein [Candidatus Hydrogenedentota bacterium]